VAIYGVSFYGTETYGAPLFLDFDATPFEAVSTGYGELTLRWVYPAGEWNRFRIVRNGYGFPNFESDGTILLDANTDVGVTFIDRNLRPENFYYYGIFVRDTENSVWVRAGDAMGLAVENYGYSEKMFRALPGWYREEDRRRATVLYPEGPLERYLMLFGLGFDHIRTEYESLRWLRNPERISANLLRLLAEQFGIPWEPALGGRQIRQWLRDAVFLYRTKGTRPGVEAAVKAITGWGADVAFGKNILRGESSQFWFPVGSTDLVDVESPDDVSQFAMYVDDDSSSGEWVIQTYPASGFAPWYGIPVTEGLNYVFQAELRADGAANEGDVTVEFVWFDEDDVEVSTTSTAPVATTDGEWIELVVEDAAPAGATQVAMRMTGTDTGDIATWVRRLQVEESLGVTDWVPAQSLRIELLPTRTNYATNPSFEQDLASWVLDGPGNYEITDAAAVDGAGQASVEITLDPSEDTILAGGPYPVPRGRFTASTYVRNAAAEVRLRWLDDSLTEIAVTPWGELKTPVGTEWVRPWQAGLRPAGATQVQVQVQVHDTCFVDAVLLEAADSPGDYFDGDFFGADFIWSGDVHASTSRYYPGRTVRNARLRILLPDYLPFEQRFVLRYTERAVGGATSDSALGVGTLGETPLGGT